MTPSAPTPATTPGTGSGAQRPAVARLGLSDWHAPVSLQDQAAAFDTLEHGEVLWLPELAFTLRAEELPLLAPGLSVRAKNVSLTPGAGDVRGVEGSADERRLLYGLLKRYADASLALLQHLLPDYAAALRPGRTSFRPAEIEGRKTSWRKDDMRLHVDSFPSSPTAGWRILRVFANVHPQGKTRNWRLGEPFDAVARRFLPGVRAPLPGSSALMRSLHITKQRRTRYDHYMLALHDRMKADLDYQAHVAHSTHEFPPATSWLVFTDQASHAAMSGQHALEQTLLIPVQALRHPELSPLRVMEGMLGRALI
jgi:hypothetical protein